MTDALTTSQVNKAGKVLRDWAMRARGERISVVRTVPERFDRLRPEQHAFFDSADVSVIVALVNLFVFRAFHSEPLTTASMGLRSMVKTCGSVVRVSQRLKRVPTIVDKLVRHPTMQLSSMQDIGGCRAVVDAIEQVECVRSRLLNAARKRGSSTREKDYIAAPRDSGYRGVHVMVQYGGRWIEVQLRTRTMHEWALAVERLGGRLDVDLKSGLGPPAVLRYLAVISEAMAREEGGGRVDSKLQAALDDARAAALPYLRGGGRG